MISCHIFSHIGQEMRKIYVNNPPPGPGPAPEEGGNPPPPLSAAELARSIETNIENVSNIQSFNSVRNSIHQYSRAPGNDRNVLTELRQKLSQKMQNLIETQLQRSSDFETTLQLARAASSASYLPASYNERIQNIIQSMQQYNEQKNAIKNDLLEFGINGNMNLVRVQQKVNSLNALVIDQSLPLEVKTNILNDIQALGNMIVHIVSIHQSLQDIKRLYGDFVKGKMSVGTLNNRWGNIKANIQRVYNQMSDIPAEYLDIPYIKFKIFDKNAPAEMKNMIGAIHAMEYIEALDQFNREIPDTDALNEKLTCDLPGNPRVKITPNSYIEIDGVSYKVESVSDYEIKFAGHEMTPAELYLALLIKSNGGSLKPDEKVKGKFIPEMNTIEKVEEVLGLDKQNRKLKRGVILQSEKQSSQRFKVSKIDKIKKQIHVNLDAKGEKQKAIDFNAFLEFWQQNNLIYMGEDDKRSKGDGNTHPFSKKEFIDGKDRTQGDKQLFRFVSFDAIINSVKTINKAFDKKWAERTELDASDLTARLGKIIGSIPGFEDVEQSAMIANHNLMIKKVNEKADEISKSDASQAGAMVAHFHHFDEKNAIEQAALILLAAKKGWPKESIYWFLGGDPNILPVHGQYAKQLTGWLASKGLPAKLEGTITGEIGNAYDAEVNGGYNEASSGNSWQDFIASTGAHNNPFKYFKIRGAVEAHMQYGGKYVGVSHYRVLDCTVSTRVGAGTPGSKNATKYNSFTDMALRKTGNWGKGTGPFLSLYRSPARMATFGAMRDLFHEFTGDKFWACLKGPDLPSTEEEMTAMEAMNYLTLGRFEEAVPHLKRLGLNQEQLGRLHFVFLHAYTMAHHTNNLSGLALKQKNSSMDSSILKDSFGLNVLMSKGWAEAVLHVERGRGYPREENKDNFFDDETSWWANITEPKLAQESKDKKILAACNFFESLSEIPAQQWLWKQKQAPMLLLLDQLADVEDQKIDIRVGNSGVTKPVRNLVELKNIIRTSSEDIKQVSFGGDFFKNNKERLSPMFRKVFEDTHALMGTPENNVERIQRALIEKSKDWKKYENIEITSMVAHVQEAVKKAMHREER